MGHILNSVFPKMVRNEDLVHPEWVMLLVKINHLLLTINSAVNILLYSYKVGKEDEIQTRKLERK